MRIQACGWEIVGNSAFLSSFLFMKFSTRWFAKFPVKQGIIREFFIFIIGF
jgi:hypothetical protein